MPAVREIQQTNVYHLAGSSEGDYPCPGGCLNYWERETGRSARRCVIQGCSNDATVGAHIQLTRGSGAVYIVPTCQSCNIAGIYGEQMQVNRGTLAVQIS